MIAGMSVGLFTLQNADVKTVGQELDRIVGDRNAGPLAGILRIVPIERMNALLIITPQPAYLEEAKKWIARLDQGGGGDGGRPGTPLGGGAHASARKAPTATACQRENA